ncbi:MAG: DEAD/DEAH box helicase [Acidobacteriota bacterium]|nr:DEAD/DEAH box helicase [Acidobacteriota bacterium]
MPEAAHKTKVPLQKVFGQGGWLARNHPQYEFRQSQLEMAEEVESCLENHRSLIAEAGTGTGKTLAYLVPILRSGRRVVISTGTKNLQEQLFYKDIPFLHKLAPGVLATLMKGRQNYLCRQKLYDLDKQPSLSGMEEVEQYARIREWEAITRTGDRAELDGLPDVSELWNSIDARREACTGQKCPQFERCFITLMHQRAAESGLIVVNHHLFFADLAVKQSGYASILPEVSAVVFDEAHEIEDVATRYFGLQISSYRTEELARDTERTARQTKLEETEVFGAVGELRHRADLFFEQFPRREGRFGFENRREFLESNQGAYSSLLNALLRMETALSRVKAPPEEITNLARRSKELREAFETVLEGKDKNRVYWWERRGRGIFVESTPIDVSSLLRERVFDRADTVILTSATLAVAGSFDFLKSRLGIRNAREKIFPSHFDFKKQAALYVPAHLPDPRDADFPRAAAAEIIRILKITRGRAFVLFTSHAQMRDLYQRVRTELRYPMLIQGSAPAPSLLKKFRSAKNAVLFATSSFWQGVDVQGQQLSAVIIDRLPFAVPSDPVVAARIAQIREEGGNPFGDYQIPEAVIALKQGFGRLIRSQTDRGVLALLDNRILRMPYGRVFLESLPDYCRTNKLEEVKVFMQKY